MIRDIMRSINLRRVAGEAAAMIGHAAPSGGATRTASGKSRPNRNNLTMTTWAQALILAAACLEGESLDAEDLGARHGAQ